MLLGAKRVKGAEDSQILTQANCQLQSPGWGGVGSRRCQSYPQEAAGLANLASQATSWVYSHQKEGKEATSQNEEEGGEQAWQALQAFLRTL